MSDSGSIDQPASLIRDILNRFVLFVSVKVAVSAQLA